MIVTMTRKQYLADYSAAHVNGTSDALAHTYWSQFVTPSLRSAVLREFNMKELIEAWESGDKHLNTLRLPRWERCGLPSEVRSAIADSNASNNQGNVPTFSLSDQISVLKHCAIMMVTELVAKAHAPAWDEELFKSL